MSLPHTVVIDADVAENHAKLIQGLYSLNKSGVAVGGVYLESVLDVIRSLRGLSTERDLFRKAWEPYTEISGVLSERYLSGLLPDGSKLNIPIEK